MLDNSNFLAICKVQDCKEMFDRYMACSDYFSQHIVNLDGMNGRLN